MKIAPVAKRQAGFFLLAFSTIFVLLSPSAIRAQDDLETMKTKAALLLEQNKPVEALPLLEKIVQAEPNNAEMRFLLGFAMIAKASNIKDKEERRAIKVRARNEFIKARDLGKTDNVVLAFIESIPSDGSEAPGFSENQEANSAMEDGEKAFTEGKIDVALALYQKAYKLDPTIYESALFSGDMFLRKEDFANAEVWYQKAIAINPNRETAYRYSATPLMRQKKYEQARDRYVEAYISEPFNRFALNGMIQWGQATNTKLGHPRFDIPKFEIGADGKANSTININPLVDDGSMAWIGYTATRSEWYEKKFAKTFPSEKIYRHTLQEETEALRSVISIVKELKGKDTKLNPQFETLSKLDQQGLLEAFVLLGIPDNGIAQDYENYLRTNRDKLRQYVLKYVINGGK